LSELVRKSAAK